MIYFFLSHNQLWVREECFHSYNADEINSGALSIYIVLLLVCSNAFYTNTPIYINVWLSDFQNSLSLCFFCNSNTFWHWLVSFSNISHLRIAWVFPHRELFVSNITPRLFCCCAAASHEWAWEWLRAWVCVGLMNIHRPKHQQRSAHHTFDIKYSKRPRSVG